MGQGVHDYSCDLRLQCFFLTKNLNRIIVRFAHLAAVQAHHQGDIRVDLGFRDHKCFTVRAVELHSYVPGNFEMLLLILPYRNLFSLIQKNIRCHEYGIR